MKKIRKILEKAAAKDKVFFTFKDKEELERIFRLLNSAGFTWKSGTSLFDYYTQKQVEEYGAFAIDNQICCQTIPGFKKERYRTNQVDFFKFLEDNNIKISSKRIPFNIDLVQPSSYIETEDGLKAKIICTTLKSEFPIVVSVIPPGINKNEYVIQATKSGTALSLNINDNLYLVTEYLELGEPEEVVMSIQEIEKALGVKNLKIVK